jgi:hypothetical protein
MEIISKSNILREWEALPYEPHLTSVNRDTVTTSTVLLAQRYLEEGRGGTRRVKYKAYFQIFKTNYLFYFLIYY